MPVANVSNDNEALWGTFDDELKMSSTSRTVMAKTGVRVSWLPVGDRHLAHPWTTMIHRGRFSLPSV